MASEKVKIRVDISDSASPMWKILWDILLRPSHDDSRSLDAEGRPTGQPTNQPVRDAKPATGMSREEAYPEKQASLFDLDKTEVERKNMRPEDQEV